MSSRFKLKPLKYGQEVSSQEPGRKPVDPSCLTMIGWREQLNTASFNLREIRRRSYIAFEAEFLATVCSEVGITPVDGIAAIRDQSGVAFDLLQELAVTHAIEAKCERDGHTVFWKMRVVPKDPAREPTNFVFPPGLFSIYSS